MTSTANRCAGPDCGRPAPDAVMCAGCAAKLRTLLRALPALLADLQVTVTKQARTTGGGARGKGHEYGLPFAWAAADDEWAIRNTVLVWARTVAYGVQLPAQFAGVCVWLAERVEHLCHHVDAGQAFDELMHLEDLAKAAVDTRSYRYIGPCTALVTVMKFPTPDLPADGMLATLPVAFVDEVCGEDLRLYAGAKLIRCRRCQAEYDAADTQLVAQLALRDHWDTAAVLAKAATKDGRKVTAQRLRNWAARGLLAAACKVTVTDRVEPGDTVYRFGDVLDLLDAAAAGEQLKSIVTMRSNPRTGSSP